MLLAVVLAALQIAAPAQASPSPSPAPSVSPAPAIPRGFSVHGSGTNVFIDQATAGIGATPPEGAAFAAGQPNAPMSPYDWFSGAPEVPGVAGEVQYEIDAVYRAPHATAEAAFVVSGVGGDVTNAIYWGEPLVGPLDPHEGRSPIPYAVRFPTHAGSNDVAAGQIVAPYNISVAGDGGRWSAAAGFVAPSRFDAFVFTPPALTSWLPSLDVQTLESVAPAIADADAWQHIAATLPLLGADATATFGKVGVEATDALLPSPRHTAARLIGSTATLDLGKTGTFSLDWVHVSTTGDALTVPTLFGSNPQLHPGPQGNLATSTIANQTQTIAGARAFFHPHDGYDATIELGRSWYDAGLVARPGTARPGNYEHVALVRRFGQTGDAGAEYFRFDPTYATALLPYGIAENVWGIAWAFPGPWLKGTYQLASNGVAGANRAGLRVHAGITSGKLEARAAYYAYRQIFPSTYDNLSQTGFVEVDYLAEAARERTLGQTHGLNAYLGWRLERDTLSVDFSQDTQYRGYTGLARRDLVDMRYPQIVVAETHRVTPNLLAVAGYGRYAAGGMWSTTPVNGIYGLGFAGGELRFDHGRQQLLIELRRYGLTGLPSIPGGPAPTLRGTAFIVDHHVTF